MELRIAETIVNAGNDQGLPLSIHENYSGRGMYRKTTTAIQYDDLGQLLAAVADASRRLVEAGKDEEFEEMAVSFDNLSQDNLGCSYLIY